LAQQGLEEGDYEDIENWRDSDRYSEREKVAIEYAERYAIDHLSLDDEFWPRFRSHWDDREIVDLTVCIASFLALGRMIQVLGPEHACRLEI